VLNRGNCRQNIFFKDEDYDAFLRVLGEGLEKYPVDVFSFTLMPNHWHMVVRPNKDGQMGRLLRWVTGTHTLRHHGHYERPLREAVRWAERNGSRKWQRSMVYGQRYDR
jgi:putative transposase